MSKFFGKTWWGESWLNALSQIDYSNRLPRGSRYARNGSVKSITIAGGAIQAEVQGSSYKPYKISITLPPFAPSKLERFLQSLKEHPSLVSKLLNRQLDPQILELAKDEGLQIFPESWKDLSIHCSCPDSAVPCKHLAAVIYKISEQIDIDPFVVFELREVKLLEAFQGEETGAVMENQRVPMLDELLLLQNSNKSGNKVQGENTQVPSVALKLAYGDLKNIEAPLVALLKPTPVFYSGTKDFLPKYSQALHRVILQANKIIDQDRQSRQEGKELQPFSRHSHVQVLIDEAFCGEFLLDDLPVSFEQTAETVLGIPAVHLPDYQQSIAVLFHGLQFALHLLAKGAIIPQVFLTKKGDTKIRWLPALISSEVRLLMDRFAQFYPAGYLQFVDKKKSATIATFNDEAVQFLSLLISHWIEEVSQRQEPDSFLRLFFQGASMAFNQISEEGISGAIQTWLQRYHLGAAKYKPRILVKETNKDAFNLDIEVGIDSSSSKRFVTLAAILQQAKYDKTRLEILQAVLQLEEALPNLGQYIYNKAKSPIVLHQDAFATFLFNMVPVIQLMDIDVLLPKSLQNILRPKASMKISATKGNGMLKLHEMLAFDWQVAIGDQVISEAEFRKLLTQSDRLIKYKSQYLYVSKEDLQKLHQHFSDREVVQPMDVLRAALSEDYEGADIAISLDAAKIIEKLTKVTTISPPKGLKATLRPYQLRGYNWMYHNAKIGFGSVIADDMGLGKTLQVITTLLKFKQEGSLDKEKALIVAPTGLLTNWSAEIERFAPSLKVQVFHGNQRKIGKDFDILLTSYGIARSDSAKLKKLPWHSLIIDEAQNIKNQYTRQSKAIKSIEANNFIAMSGTPVENRLSELWSIMDYSNRNLLGDLNAFQENYGKPIESLNDEDVAAKLKKVIAPFMMRRLKTDKKIISDLPDKVEINSYANLTEAQASLYESTLKEAMKSIEAMDPKDKKSLFARKGLVLQLILALKQICNHPTQFLKNKILNSQLSGKMDLLFDKLDTIAETGEKVLIFTQFKEMGLLLQYFIEERYKEKPLFYHGGCSIKQRKEMTEAFQQNPADKVFILSLKAAGTGLNLTAANHVIHFDLWWNPAVEAQATDRAFRIGQQKNVFVHRFITKNTFEEKIDAMIQSKKKLADLTVSSGESWIGNLSNKELKEIFRLD
jgi:uncharacterized Zn finger protein/ERCC4-related helicase